MIPDAAPPFCRSTPHLTVCAATPSIPAPGRHAVLPSSGDVPAGTVLSRSAPLAHVLQSDFKEDRCARCFSKPQNLARCSRCRKARYCGRECQLADFCHHKLECKRGGEVHTEAVREEAELLARTRAALTKGEEGASEECVFCLESGSDEDASPVVRCGRSHFDSMARSSRPPNDAADLLAIDAASRLCRDREWGADDIGRYLLTFRANNFGILDGMLNVIGSGVYPHGAVLNHSCDPNCVLRYVFGKATVGPIMEIVALRDICEGEELTHSYVDLVNPTEVRRGRLKAPHGFECNCRRCEGRCEVTLPADFVERPHEAVEWIQDNYNPCSTLNRGTPVVHVVQVEIDDAMSRCRGARSGLSSSVLSVLRADAVAASNRKQEEARRHMSAGDTESEIRCAEEAVSLLSSNPAIPPLCVELYSARGALLSSLLFAGQTDKALDVCQSVVAFLCVALGHVLNHPLLGLQLFTLGDLHAGVGDDVKAKVAYSWARDVLRVCQGRDSDMVQRLNSILDC